jgi:UDP-glucose 4-epimerase
MTNFSGPVMVTGGAGFIGSEVVSQLVKTGAEVTVVDNLVNGKKENIEPFLDVGARLKIVDIRDEENLKPLVKGTTTIFHLACLGVRHSLHSPFENHEVNATATLRLLQMSKEFGVSRFVQVSTSEVYGTARWAPMTEDHPTAPETVYGASKLAGESYALAFFRTHGYPSVVVRPFNAYGPRSHHEGDSGEVIPKMMLRAMVGKPLVVFGDGSQTRDFNYVSDTARGIILAGLSEKAVGQTLNIGSGREISISDLAKKIAVLNNQDASIIQHNSPRPGDVMRLCADSTKARQLLGYQPEVNMETGLKLLRSWYEKSDLPPEFLLKSEIVENWNIR